MKLMKRATALLLCFLMLSSGPISAFATEGVSDNDVVVETTTTTSCAVCSTVDCATEHIFCESCGKFDCGKTHVIQEVTTFSSLARNSASGDFGDAAYDVKNSDNHYTGAAIDDTHGAIAEGDQFKLTLTWNENNFVPGGTYTYTTPVGFVLYTSDYSSKSLDDGTVQDDNGHQNGSFSFSYDDDTKTSTVTITFNSDYADIAAGKLELYGKFDNPEDADPDGDGYISIPEDENYPIYEEPAPEQSYSVNVDKEGYRKEGGEKPTFHYYIQVTAPDGDLTNVVVTDTPDANMTLLTGTVYGSSNYYATNGDALTTTQGSNDSGSPTYSWTIPEIKSGQSYYIFYDAEAKDDSKAYLVNEVVATADDKSASDTAQVSLNAPNVKKTGTMNAAGDTVTWKIEVTFNDFDTVKLDENNGDTSTIMRQAQNADATYTVTYQPSSRQVTGNYADAKEKFVLTRESGETSAVLTFNMILPSTWADTHDAVDNTVWYYYGNNNGNASSSVPVTATPRIKNKTGKDLASNHTDNNYTGGKPEIQWEVDLSFAEQPSQLYNGNPRFGDILVDTHNVYDTAGLVNHQYIQDSFELYLNEQKVDWNVYIQRLSFLKTGEGSTEDKTFLSGIRASSGGTIWDWDGQQAFIIEFAESAPAGNYTLKYKTSYDPSKSTSTYDYVENAFFANNYEYKSTTVKILLNYIRKAANDYNANTANDTDSEVTWNIVLEPMGDSNKILYFMDTGRITVTDTLPDGFSVKSVKLKSYNGAEESFTQYTPDGYTQEPNLSYQLNDNQLVMSIGTDYITFAGWGKVQGGTYLEIVTEYEGFENLVPGKKSQEFTNTAHITVNGTTYSDVSASVTFTPPPLISKEISYMRENAPRPQFTVEVNPNAEDLMKNSDTITIRDVIISKENEEPNQTFLADTLKVYEGIGAGKTLVNAGQYTVNVNSEKTEFTITGLKDATAYTIEYRTFVDVPYDQTTKFHLINRAYLDGVCRDMNEDGNVAADEYVYAEENWYGLVQLPSAINNLSTEYPTVFVEKTDATTGELLKGAVFTIYDESNNEVGTIISGGEDGLTSGYRLTKLNHTYTMKETAAPEGYVLNEETVWMFGRYTNGACPNNVDNLNGEKMKVYTITNKPEKTAPETTSLTIYKSGGAADENFVMHVSGGGLTMKVVVPANGSVTIDGLTVGETYTVTEDESWAWRYTIGNPGSITLEADSANNKVTVTNTKNIFKWLSGDSYCENWWGGADGNVVRRDRAN